MAHEMDILGRYFRLDEYEYCGILAEGKTKRSRGKEKK